jgi:hypothetical protein
MANQIMIGQFSPLNTPTLWVNKYLSAKLNEGMTLIFGDGLGIGDSADFPFFPSTPSTINDLTQYFNASTQGVAATWDRLIKMNKTGFPHIKCEQMLYYFYAQATNPVEKMVAIQELVLRLMDRGDETAREVNAWCANRSINIGTDQNPEIIDNQFFFHNFKVYQLEETRDIIDFGTARTYGGNKMIIDYDYHQMNSVIPDEPEARQSTKTVIR